MSAEADRTHLPGIDAAQAARLEARLARIESHLGLVDRVVETPGEPGAGGNEPATHVAPVLNASPKTEAAGELEIALGQDWFAAAGILTLALGGGFMLSLPYSGWPSALPSVLGYLAVAVFFGIAQAGRRSFTHAAGFLHGAGMALLYWATLRLYFFGEHQVLDPQGPAGAAVLVDFTDATAAGAALTKVCRDDGRWARLRADGVRRAQAFSFEQLARERVAAILDVIGAHA